MNKNIIKNMRDKTPLIHCITNYVTINDCANILLSYGASPAMCEAYDEVYDFAAMSSALYINLGTLTKEQEAAAILASMSAKNHNVPVILDPVGCPAMKRKVEVIKRISEVGRIDIIKGNIGEIKYLSGMNSETRGVDSIDNGENALEACLKLSQRYNCVVAATGKKDYISNGKQGAIINNGTEMLTKVTGTGCMLGALCSATAASFDDKFISTITAILSMNIAGEKAYRRAKLPGSFKVALIDSIYTLSDEEIWKEGNIEWI
ncbi:hydroxyethylthiazole kinase [Clostridium niameyense]|uniref:Hydroxyethylthiazole kinase n=1 Tax=Clostridium niameyense TaxID=1622073 RepID=A0A6M0RD25_9CLOT|nr:hydroxyethylthiazole kinase [Clostridium niameyense]NEZ47479.1 hydroxyethylthiazole kinase [Clostridium niameyense]